MMGQKRCRVFGVVRDDMGSPLELSSIQEVGTANGTLANLKGEYSLYVSSGDSVTIRYSMIGYETRKRTLVKPSMDSLRIDIVLPVYSESMREAVVKGQHIQTGTTQQIAKVDPHLQPSTTGNAVEELIATQAGVSTHSELSSQYNVRGGSFDENCVYLNGFEVYRPMLVRSGQQEGLSVINPDMVENIAFSSGGFEPKYGDKMSSVLDITYKHPEKFELTANGSLLGGGIYLGLGNKKVSFMTSVRYKTTKYLLNSLDTQGEYNPNFLDYQGVFSWRPNQRWTIDLIANYSDNHFNFKPADRETKFGTMDDPKSFKVYFDGQEKDYFRTLFGALNIAHNFNPDTYLALQFSTYATKEQEAYDISGEYWLQEATSQEQLGVGTYMEHARNRLRAQVYNGGLRFRTRVKSHVLQAGFNFQHQDITNHSREWEMRDSMGYTLPHDENAVRLIYALEDDSKMTANRLEFFAQDVWRIKSKIGLFNVTYGFRVTNYSWNKETVFSPRVSVGFLPENNDHWVARFATGFYYQTPFFKEVRDTTLDATGLATVTLNRNIKSQRSIHFVLGADYSFRVGGRPFKFTMEGYYKALSNLIPYSVDNVRVVYYGRNMAKGYAVGLDFKIFGEFVPGTDSWLTLSLMSTKEKIDGVWLPRPTDQRYAINLHFTDYFPGTTRWSFTLKAAVADGLPFGPPHSKRETQTFRAPAYKRVDVGMSYYIIQPDSYTKSGRKRSVNSLIVGLDCFNILGIKNVNSYYWVTDINNVRYAVPNYLTGRQLNLRLVLKI